MTGRSPRTVVPFASSDRPAGERRPAVVASARAGDVWIATRANARHGRSAGDFPVGGTAAAGLDLAGIAPRRIGVLRTGAAATADAGPHDTIGEAGRRPMSASE